MRWAALGLVRAVAVSAGMGLLSSALATTDEIHWTVIGPTSVTFDWRGPLSENSIQYGLDAGSYTKSVTALPPPGNCTPWSSPGPFWEARLTGLSPDTLYHYSIANGPDHTFRTPPLPGASSFVVLAQADIGESTSYGTMLPVQQLMAQELDARFVLMVGDLSYGRSHGAAKDDQHFNDVMLWSQDVAYMPAWGNNEYDIPPENVDDLRNFEGRFEFANPRSSPGTQGNSSCGEDWYWFDYGNVRFIAYPEPWTGAVADWTSQATPLMDAAQADPNIRFIVTFGHRPAYSSGHHPGEGPLKASLDALSSTHSKYVLNVNGHSHNYERTHPQDGSGGNQNGAVHVTVGTGGSNLEQDGACLWLTCTQPAWSAARFMHLGYLKLYFTPTSIQGAFLCGPAGGGTNDITCPAGSVIDSFSIGPPVCIDPDGDGYGNPGDSACPNGPATDCAPTDPGVYPGAPEKNDGHDNQCPGNPGYGLIDETSGNSGFLNATNKKTEYSWPTQSGETLWEVARAEAPDFSVGCMTVQSSVANWTDTQVPALGHVFFYLNRPVAPYVGSWGAQSSGVERTGICPATGTATAVGGLVASLDDAEESGTGVMRLNSSDLDLTLDGTYQTVGMRFNGLPIPHGARILNAYVQFAVGDASSASTALKIQGQSADRPSAFTAENGNLSSRSKTSAFASWNPPPWTAGEAGVNQRTPDLSAIVREIVIRPGWVGGDPLVIIITGTGDRSAKAWDYNSGAGAPQLHVAYDGGGVPVCPDPDRDGYGNPGTSVCPNGPATDCDTNNQNVYPGAAQICDGLNDDCSSLGWPSLEGTNEFDNDGDGLSVCTGDCNDTTSLCTTDCTDTDGDGACNPFDTCTDTDGDGFGNSGFPANTCPVDCSPTDPLTHPGAPERNDGRDNQCPGDLGYGSIDETTGDSGFHSVTKAKTKYSWPSQQGATSWEVARAGSPDFSLGCGTVATSGTNWTDAQVPSSGRVFYYLNRPASPFAGSWGARSSGVERTGICPAAP